MNIISNIYYVLLAILTIFNRGGASVGFGNINTVLIIILLSPILYFAVKGRYPIKIDLPIILFISIIYFSLAYQIIVNGFTSDDIRVAGIYLYPISILGGISLTRQGNFKKTLKVIKFIFIFSIFYSFTKPFTSFFIGKILVNGYNLIGMYGSYYTVTVSSFCYFFSGFGSQKNKNILSVGSAIGTIIFISRNGFIGLITAFLINITSKSKALFSKKSIKNIAVPALLLIVILAILFPLLNTLIVPTDTRGGEFSLKFTLLAVKSIFIRDENTLSTFTGGAGHRLDMWTLGFMIITSKLNYFLLGIPLNINYTDSFFNDPHNGYISLFVRGGFLTLFLFINLQYQIIKQSLIIRNRLGPNNFSAFSLSFLISSLIMITFSTCITSPMNAIPYYFLIGAIWQINNQQIKDLKII